MNKRQLRLSNDHDYVIETIFNEEDKTYTTEKFELTSNDLMYRNVPTMHEWSVLKELPNGSVLVFCKWCLDIDQVDYR